jgi:hypothetical protein
VACRALCIGARVQIKGLTSYASRGYNGMTGYVRGREGKRWEVEVRGLGEDLILKGRNLEVLGCTPRRSAAAKAKAHAGSPPSEHSDREHDEPLPTNNCSGAPDGATRPLAPAGNTSAEASAASSALDTSGRKDASGARGTGGKVEPGAAGGADWRGPIAAEEERLRREALERLML